MALEGSDTRKLATRLVAQAGAERNASGNAAVAAHSACERTYRALSRSVGAAGAQALLMRALKKAQGDHPILESFHVGSQNEPGLGAIAASIQSSETSEVAVGLEVVLQTMLDLLGRLVGEDMVAQLVDHHATIETHNEQDVQ